MNPTYHLKDTPSAAWREVSEAEFVQAERRAGFKPKDCLPQDKPATGGFGRSGGVQGKVQYPTQGRALWFGENPPMDAPPSPV